MLTSPYLEIVSALMGLIVGALIVFAAPRLVAYRLSGTTSLPGWEVLIPLVGVWIRRWRVVSSLALEALTAVVFAALAARYGASSKLLISGFYSALLIAISYVDLDYRLVLNRLSYPGVVLALMGGILWPGIGLTSAALGAAVGLGIFLFFQLIARGAMGVGDMKLALLVGAMRGFPEVFNALLIGTALGGLGAAFALIILRRGRRGTIAYGPYLAAGAIVSFLVR